MPDTAGGTATLVPQASGFAWRLRDRKEAEKRCIFSVVKVAVGAVGVQPRVDELDVPLKLVISHNGSWQAV